MKYHILTTLIICLLAVGAVSAFQYVPDKVISVDEFKIVQVVEEDKDDYVYSISPIEHQKIQMVLSGSADFLPSLLIYDPDEDEIIFSKNLAAGNVISHDFISSYDKRKAKELYLIVETSNKDGKTFSLEYDAIAQDDAGFETDSSIAFREGFLLESGSYNGFLGGPDSVDNYRFQLRAGNELSLEIVPRGTGSLKLALIDGGMNRKIDKQVHDGNTLVASFLSPRDQTVYLGIEGDIPYTLVLSNTGAEEEVPPMPPDVPDIEEEHVESVISVGDKSPEEMEEEPVVAEEEKTNNPVVILVVVLIIIVAIIVFYLKGKEPKEEKKVLDEAKKKKTPKKKAAKKK